MEKLGDELQRLSEKICCLFEAMSYRRGRLEAT